MIAFIRLFVLPHVNCCFRCKVNQSNYVNSLDCYYVSATAAATFLFGLPFSDLHALIIVIFSATLAAFGLVHGILLVSHPNSTLIIAEVVDSSINIIVDHLTCL